jgi:hypothetical protein
VISSSQRTLPNDTQLSQQTDIHAPGGTRTHNLSRRAATIPHLRPRGHWDRECFMIFLNLYLLSYAPSFNNESFNGPVRMYFAFISRIFPDVVHSNISLFYACVWSYCCCSYMCKYSLCSTAACITVCSFPYLLVLPVLVTIVPVGSLLIPILRVQVGKMYRF